MEVANCSECKKLYIKEAGIKMCPDCLKKEEEYEEIVTEYVKTHRRCTVEEVHKVTGVKIIVIYRMIESGRIQECGNLEYPCQQCKKFITKGRLCKTCMEEFLQQVEELKAKEKKTGKIENEYQSAGMYTKLD